MPLPKLYVSENSRQLPRSRSTPISCIVCHRVFFDNVSLVLHFECHLRSGISTRRQHSREASLQSWGPLSLSLSPYPCSSVERTNEARHRSSPRVKGCFRPPSPNPVSSAMPNLTSRDSGPFDARLNVSQPINHSLISPYAVNSSSAYPFMYSQLGARTSAYGSAAAPHLQLQEQNAGQVRFSNHWNPRKNQAEMSVPEIIIISDDEEDDKNADGIDLTLKL